MAKITVRELRNNGGRVLERVEQGETLTITRDGRPVAELRPLPVRPVPAETLLRRWQGLPALDATKLRADIDAMLDSSL